MYLFSSLLGEEPDGVPHGGISLLSWSGLSLGRQTLVDAVGKTSWCGWFPDEAFLTRFLSAHTLLPLNNRMFVA